MTKDTNGRAIIRPQDGYQVQYLSSRADIVIGGGAAGVGKSWCLLCAPLRHKNVPGFNAITFRRTNEQIRYPGGLWDKSMELYPLFNLKPSEQQLEWYVKENKVTLKFSHLQHEKNIYDHDGPEYCLICWDELQHFTRKMFFYLLSRNRSTCGVRPYVMATCNPDPDSFLAEMLEWWIDQEEKFPNGENNPHWGYPITERVGKLRYLVVHDDQYVWADTKDELILANPDIFADIRVDANVNPHDLIKSVTFIGGSIYENQELLKKNPQYLANLMSLDQAEQLRLFYGNWKIRGKDDCIFNSIAITNIFDNPFAANTTHRYITCDAARFGDDFATIWVWQGWRVIKLIVLTKSDKQEIVDAIEMERSRNAIIKSHVIVDQDGVGGGVVKDGGYQGFHGNAIVLEEPGTFIKENYKNRKTQFAYRFADKVNADEVSIQLDSNNVVVDGVFGVKVKWKGKVFDVRELTKQDFKAIRKKDIDNDGKKQINDKVEQKRLLGDRSPDFFDGLYLRIHFTFNDGDLKIATGIEKTNKGNGTIKKSLLDYV